MISPIGWIICTHRICCLPFLFWFHSNNLGEGKKSLSNYNMNFNFNGNATKLFPNLGPWNACSPINSLAAGNRYNLFLTKKLYYQYKSFFFISVCRKFLLVWRHVLFASRSSCRTSPWIGEVKNGNWIVFIDIIEIFINSWIKKSSSDIRLNVNSPIINGCHSFCFSRQLVFDCQG
jgi:hypothetical protein